MRGLLRRALAAAAVTAAIALPAASHAAAIGFDPPVPDGLPVGMGDVPALGPGDVIVPVRDRAYLLHVPPPLRQPPLRPVPALLVLHGWRNTPDYVARQTGFSTLADQTGVLVAYPYGLDKSWNAGTCCGSSSINGVNDVGFLAEVVADLTRRGAAYVSVVGFSNGGMMAYRFACERPELIRRVGVMAGSLQIRSCPAPIDVLHMHGLADKVVPYEGTRWSYRLASPVRDVRTEPSVVRRGSVTVVPLPQIGHQWPTIDYDGVDASNQFWRFLIS